MPPLPGDNLKWAVGEWKQGRRTQQYLLYRNYYMGNQRLAFATERFRNTFGNLFSEFSENVCESVVDALSDRLEILGFQTSAADIKTEEVESNVPTAQPRVEGMLPTPKAPGRKKVTVVDPLGDQAHDIWKRNRMDQRSQEVHEEALSMGDSYVIVWPDAEGQAQIWPQLATECRVQYDPENTDKVMRAAKVWWDYIEKRWYLSVYTEDGITKYEQNTRTETMPATEAGWSEYDFVPNLYSRVPMFHFPNRAIRKFGFSELKDVVSLQDALNKSVMDMLVAMEFASFKQRWVAGMEVEIDPETGEPVDPNAKNYGVDRLLAFADPETKIGQFDATDLDQFLRVQEKFWASVARVSGTPLHYFFITEGDFPSGEAMKSAEARFVKKILDRQTSFGNVWEDVVKFCMEIEEITVPEDFTIEVKWQHAAPRSEAEIADTAVKKKAVGVSRSVILSEFGYTDEEIERMLEESDADTERQSLISKPPFEPSVQNPNGQPRPGPSQRPGSGVRR